MSRFDDKMNELAEAIKSKNPDVSGKLSIAGMIDAVDGITISDGSSVDVSGVTATPATVLDTVKFVDKDGVLYSGAIPTVTPTLNGNTVTVPAGFVASAQEFTVSSGADLSGVTATAETVLDTVKFVDKDGVLYSGSIPTVTPTLDGNTVTVPAGFVASAKEFVVSGAGGSDNVEYAYYAGNGKAQVLDLSGTSPVNSGEPVDIDAVLFRTGQNEPLISGGATQFYRCSSYDSGIVPSETELYTVMSWAEGVNGIYHAADYTASGADAVFQHASGSKLLPVQSEDDPSQWTLQLQSADGSVIGYTDSFTSADNVWSLAQYLYANDGPLAIRRCKFSNADVILAANAGVPAVNGIYARVNSGSFMDFFAADTVDAWINSDGSVTIDVSAGDWSDELETETAMMSVSITGTGTAYYTKWQDIPLYEWSISDVSELNSQTWEFGSAGVFPAPGFVNKIAIPESLHPPVWSGTQAVQDAATGKWSFSSTITNDLAVNGFEPVAGKIYSADTTVKAELFGADAINMPDQENLVFFAPLEQNYTDLVSGNDAVRTAGEFGKFLGQQCLEFTGDSSDWCKWIVENKPENFPCTIGIAWASKTLENSRWQEYIAGGIANISSKYQNVKEWGYSYYNTNVWTVCIVTYSANGEGKMYINGVLQKTRSDQTAGDITDKIVVGSNQTGGAEKYIDGFVKGACLWKSELTAEQVRSASERIMGA